MCRKETLQEKWVIIIRLLLLFATIITGNGGTTIATAWGKKGFSGFSSYLRLGLWFVASLNTYVRLTILIWLMKVLFHVVISCTQNLDYHIVVHYIYMIKKQYLELSSSISMLFLQSLLAFTFCLKASIDFCKYLRTNLILSLAQLLALLSAMQLMLLAQVEEL